MALLMMLRDSGLPLPGGAIPISPWVDLTHSLPSCQTNLHTDYLPFGSDEIPFSKRQITGGDSLLPRLHFYAPDHILKHHLVSPLYDPKQWRGLPPLLIQTGDAEQLRDESICASFKATNTFSTLDGAPPTSTLLDLYQDQPHVFQLLLPSKAVHRSVLTMAEFLRDPTVATGLTIRAVSFEGEIQDVTPDTVARYGGAVWTDWIDRLDHTSFKGPVAKL
jgi:acetyl esterase/lipase